MDPVTLISNAIDLAQKLRVAAERIREAETRLIVADLTLALSDLKIQIAALQDENFELRRKLEVAGHSFREIVAHKDGMAWLSKPPPRKNHWAILHQLLGC